MEFEFEEKQGTDNGSEKMNQEPGTGNLVDTTDCLEAVSAIRCWKNFLFLIILLALLLLQGSFWIVNLNLLKSEPSATVTVTDEPAVKDIDAIKQAAKQAVSDANAVVNAVAAEPNQPALSKAEGPAQDKIETSSSRSIRHWFKPGPKHISAVVRFLNFVLIPASMLHCLAMLLSLKISLIGRLGGINHIARAFFLSLLFVVLLMPWQLIFSPVFAGAMFTPAELIAACEAQKTALAYASMYLRFSAYWFLVLLLLLLAQIRSMRWASSTLRRLEVI